MTELRPYQREAVRAMDKAAGRAIFAYAPGTGKTATVTNWLAGDYAKSDRILVVAPNGPVLDHWAQELWRFGAIVGCLGTGTPKKRAIARNAPVLIVNYETMRGDIDALLEIPWDAVIFDESHRLKNRKSLVFKAAAKLARRVDKILLVTGTPILNRAEELWTSLHILEPTRYKSFWRWAEHHFQVDNKRYGGRLVREVGRLRPGHPALLRSELGSRLIQKPLSELLPDLPPVSVTYMATTLSAAERRSYDSMNENFWMQHGDEIIQAPNVISQSTRLRQLASDWSTFNGTGELGSKAKAAISIASDLVEDGEQVVIFCAYRSTVDAIFHELPKSLPYHGGLPSSLRNDNIKAFARGDIRVLIGTLATMSEGIDGMQVARNVIFLDRDWTPARNEQAVARLQRSGQMSSVNVTHLVAENTIDQRVAEALRAKQSVINAVLGSNPHKDVSPRPRHSSSQPQETTSAVHRP